jgi:Na+-driven multidrug efflux pump
LQVPRSPLTEGSIRRNISALAGPLALSSVLMGGVSMIEAWMVGHLGKEAIAAGGMSRQMMMILLMVGGTVSTGTTALVARYVGGGKWEQARQVTNQSFLFILVLCLTVLTPLGWFLSRPLLGLLGAAPEVVELGVPYLRLNFAGLAVGLTAFVMSASLRGAGDAQTPLRVNLLTNVINVGADYLFIFGPWGLPRWGLNGAAMGALLARGVAFALLFWILWSGRFVAAFDRTRGWRFNYSLIGRIFRIGLPASLVGQNLGADKPERAAACGWEAAKLTVLWMAGMGTLFFLFPRPLIALFIRGDKGADEVIAMGVQFMRINAFALPLLGLGITLSGGLQGAGDTTSPMRYSFISQICVGLPLCWFLSRVMGWGTTGIWIGLSVAMLVRGGLATWKFHRGEWQRIVI